MDGQIGQKNGAVLGSSGSVIEALEARLIDLPQYSVQIQPQVEGEWWGYVYDGQTAGSIGSKLTAYRVEIVQRVYIAPKNISASTTSTFSCPSLASDEIYLYAPNPEMRVMVQGDTRYFDYVGSTTTPISDRVWGREITVKLDYEAVIRDYYNLEDNYLNARFMLVFNYVPDDFFNDGYDLYSQMIALSANDTTYICYGSGFGIENKTYVARDANYYNDYSALENKLGWYWTTDIVEYDINGNTIEYYYQQSNILSYGTTVPQ